MSRRLILGIDTGGTHTDAVVFDPAGKAVLASAKAETTHHDLSLGIGEALARLSAAEWPGGRAAVDRIHLSTTLATNSVAEGYSAAVGLIMIGYDAGHEAVRVVASRLPMAETVFVAGGHDYFGREEAELDEAAVKEAVENLAGRVGGWAVSGMFSVKNPDHELRAAAIIKSVSDKPVTMGRDLTGQYDAVRRAATAALNAGLVVIINNLLDAVRRAADQAGFKARLMVVKGDGSLVSEEWAREKPIETVASGPAASALGVGVLGRGLLRAGEENVWILDVGGTTTDLAYLKKGRPVISRDGARIGPWSTMTAAVETRTRGLGGDSLVELSSGTAEISLGPRRVLPLCRLARKWPAALATLQNQKSGGAPATLGGVFFLPGTAERQGLSPDEALLVKALEREAPLPFASYARELHKKRERLVGLKVLQHPAILAAAFTPTDAMSVLGLYNEGSREAAALGAEIMGRAFKLSAEELAVRVLDEFGRLLAQEVVSHSLDQAGVKYEAVDFAADGLLGGALGRRGHEGLELVFRSPATTVLLGGPASALAPFFSRYLEGRLIVPPVFDTANAVGAAAAPISLTRQAEIHLLPSRKGYRLFLPDGIVDGWSVEVLTDLARERMTEYMARLARLAGADNPKISLSVDDRRIILKNGRVLNMGAGLSFTVEQAG
ncbi:hydantoinase/oxoprolinase family protein [Deltaproteobacteria bacterium OttesenSCG-928-M10]|nr:hydantoinase/oxoprolinase family protein [Deltaproteobacteria bacterium OttesenSCG-928-M10]